MKKSTISVLLIFILCSSYGQVSTDTLSVYRIKPKHLIDGDRNSKIKEGSYYSYYEDGKIHFIRTYVNDTLNGFLGCYSPFGYVNSEKFYKKGKQDSLYFDYYRGNILEKKGEFKNGYKHGIFLEFYENGNLKYEGFYQNDTLIGNEICYYENKIIRSLGNKKNGVYKTFYKDGEIESIKFYENYEIVREQLFYPAIKKYLTKPLFIKPQIVLLDTNIINETNLTVSELFSNYNANPRVGFIAGFNLYKYDTLLIIKVISEHRYHYMYSLTGDGLYQCNECFDYDSDNLLHMYDFGVWVRGDSNYVIPNSQNVITVHQKGMRCQDTGNNPVTIQYEGKNLEFSDLKNVNIFEYDADKNHQNEIYIISFESCEGKFKILKIE